MGTSYTGASGGDTITGGGGSDDVLNTGGPFTGTESLSDSGSNDTFYVYSTADTVDDSAAAPNGGVIESTVTWSLASTQSTGVDDLTLTGAATITGTGNTSADVLTSSTGGINKLIGDGGDDTFNLNHVSDTATESNVAGGAVVNSTITFALGANMADLNLTGAATITGTGNTSADVLTSSTGGINKLIGDGGDDTFNLNHAGDTATESNVAGGAVVNSTITFALGANMADLTLTGSGALNGTAYSKGGDEKITGNANTSTTAFDTLSDGGDSVVGMGDTLIGQSTHGNDTFLVNNADDSVTETAGGAGDTALVKSIVSFSIDGTGVNHLTLSGASAITGTGNTLASVLTSSTTGTDVLIGNALDANDTFYVYHSGDTVSDNGNGTANEVISNSTVTVGAGIQDLILSGAVAITGTGNGTADVLTGSTTGIDKLIGEGGADTFNIDHASDTATESNGAGGAIVNSTISFTLGANMSGLTLEGASLKAVGNAGADTLTSSSAGADTLYGESSVGGDTFVVNHASDIVTEAGSSNVGDLIKSDVSFNLGTSGPNTTVKPIVATTTNVNDLELTAAHISGVANSGGDTITGSSSGPDTLIGNATGTDSLSGAGGADVFQVYNTTTTVAETNGAGGATVLADFASGTFTLGTNMSALTLSGTGAMSGVGNTSADILTSSSTGTGTDTLIGQSTTGGDTFYVNHSGDVVSEATSSTNDSLIINVSSAAGYTSTANLTLDTGMADLTLAGAVVGTKTFTGFTATGNANNDVITDNTTGTGKDTLVGGSSGIDTFVVNHAGDVISAGGTTAASDVVHSSVSLTLGAGMLDLTLTNTGTTAVTGTGSSLAANILTSSSTGKDALIGEAGDDTFTLNYAGDSATESNTAGGATVNSTITYALGANMTTLNLTGAHLSGTASTGADTITSTGGVDTLIGGIGADSLQGAGGADVFHVNSATTTVAETNGAGGAIVLADFATGTFTLTSNMSALTLSGTGTMTGVGNTGADVLTSSTTGTDVLIGHSLNGGDTFIVNHSGDTVTELGSSSDDAVLSNISWELSPNMNSLTLNAAGLTGTGDSLANVLTAYTSGADTLIGNSTDGGDTFVLYNSNDVISETTSSANDAIKADFSVNLGTFGKNGSLADATQLTLSGSTALTGTGNSLADVLTSSTTGKDVLIGHDTSASAGDTFNVNYAGDLVSEAGSGTAIAAHDLIVSDVSFDLATAGAAGTTGANTNVDHLTLTGTLTITGTGNTSADVLTSSTGGINALIGDATAGGDTFYVNHSGDTVTEKSSTNTGDLVSSDVSFSLATGGPSSGATNVNSLILTASGISGVANSGADTIANTSSGADTLIGGAGADSLTGAGGADVFHVNSSGTQVAETNVAGGASVFADFATGAFTLGTNMTDLTLSGAGTMTGTGNSLASVLTSSSTGSDTLIGEDTSASTHDTFYVNYAGDLVSEAGASTGALVYSTVTYTLGAGMSSLTLTGAATGQTATAYASGNDTVSDTSTAGHNILADGGSGGGNDSLLDNSTAGGDTFLVNNTGDTISALGAAAGVVQSTVNFTLGSNLDSLTLENGAATSGAGNVSGADTITGNTNNDVLSDNDTGTADKLIGKSTEGSGGDTFIVYDTGDIVTETGSAAAGSLIQVANTGAVSFTLNSTGANNVSNLTFLGSGADSGTGSGSGGDTITGNTGSDVLSDGANSGGSADMLVGNSTAGTDVFNVNNSADTVTETHTTTAALVNTTTTFSLVGTGVNQMDLITTATGTSATGNGGNDLITDNSAAGHNILSDGTTLAGNGGHDTFVDNTGNDTFIVNSVFDSVSEMNSHSTTGEVETTLNYTLGANLNILQLENGIAADATGNAAGADSIIGNQNNDVLSDNTGIGSTAPDADTLIGNSSETSGTSGDTFVIYNANDVISEEGSSHSNTTAVALIEKTGAVAFSLLNTGVDELKFTGTGNDTGTAGATGGDTVIGSTGNDILSDGGSTSGGGDSLQGNSSTGGDTFIVYNSSDTIAEAGNIGGSQDGIVSFIAGGSSAFNSLTGAYAGFYNLTLSGTASASATGNNLANTLIGNSANDTLISGSGDDTMIGNSGVASGGDTFEVNNVNDHVTEVNINETAALITSSVSYALVANVDQLTLTDSSGGLTATGNSTGGDTLIGGGGSDVLNDNTNTGGADSLVGNSTGTGDTFIVNNANDAVTETHTVTGSLVQSTAASFSLVGTGVHSLVLEGTGSIAGTASGNGGNDTVTGNTGSDTLSDGGDTTSGVGDVLIGNSTSGNDAFIINDASDTISETNGADTGALIESSIAYTLGAGFAQLDLIGIATTVTAAGNASNDTIIDNSTAGHNVLTDANAGGTDSMVDNAGNDTFIVYNSNDTVVENDTASTTTTVDAYVSYTLGAHMNHLILEGTDNITGTASTTGGEKITGNIGNDVLSDGGDVTVGTGDTLIGNTAFGHDTFIVYNAADLVSEASTASTNSNLVEAYTTFDLGNVTGTLDAVDRLTLEGTGGGLTATGNGAANDTIIDSTSGGGNVLISGSGIDDLTDSSTGGSDTFIVNNTGDTVTEGAGTGTIEFETNSNINYTIGAHISSVNLGSVTGDDTITSNSAGDDTLTASSGAGINVISDGLVGGTGGDMMYAGAGASSDDTFIINNGGDTIIGSNTGDVNDVIDDYIKGANASTYATFTLVANINNLVLEGTGNGYVNAYANSGNDVITAHTLSNTFTDGGTNDGNVVTNAGGNDTFLGGGGFDVFTINNGNDYVSEAHAGQYLINSYASFDLNTQATNVSNLTLLGTADLTGTASEFSAGGAVIVGNEGSDVLSDGGQTSNVGDILIGNSTVTGIGNGDTFIVSDALDTVSEAGTGIGTVEASISYTLGTGTNDLILTGTNGISGAGNIAATAGENIVGNTGADTLSDGGNDTGSGPAASAYGDTLIGHSATNDVFTVYNTLDAVTEEGAATSGSIIDSYVSFNLLTGAPGGGATAVNTLTLMGVGVSGTHLTATGNNAADTLNDTTTGTYSGHDILNSGAGADTLVDKSVTGDDTFYIQNTNDSVTETNGTAGVVDSTVSWTLGAHMTTLTLEGGANANATGLAAGGDTLTANSGTDILNDNNTSGAADSLIGGTGHDTFIVGNTLDTIDSSGGGVYTMDTSATSGAFTSLTGAYAGFTKLILTGTTDATGTAGAGSDTLVGNSGDDTLHDGGSADVMQGNDSIGGAGHGDTFFVTNTGDVVTEAHAETAAEISTTVSFTLSSNITNMVLTGTGTTLTATGNSGADSITDTTTGAGHNVLYSGTGLDTLIDTSTNGDDTFYVQNSGDHVTETNGVGTIESTVTFTLGANMTTLTLEGDANLIGAAYTSGADTITGNSGDDTLSDNSGGADKLVGMSLDGGDVFDVTNVNDTVTENVSGGTATVNATLATGHFTLGSNVDILNLTTGDGVTITGNSGHDTITDTSGSTGSDTLSDGGSETGIAHLTDNSGSGGDVFDVSSATDVVTESHGTGTIDFTASGNVSWTLGTNIGEINAATATGNDTLTDNTSGGADTIIGGTGNDLITDGGAGTSGADDLVGHSSSGSDTFVVNNTSDTVAETHVSTTATLIESSVSWNLTSHTTNVNNVELMSNAIGTGDPITATGNANGDILTDNVGGNLLLADSASTANDTLIGGNDTMTGTGSTGQDTFELSATVAYSGIATITNFNTAHDTLNIDNIISGGSGSFSASNYEFVSADAGAATEVLVDYKPSNPSYGFVEVATLDVAFASHGSIIVT